MSEAKQKDQNSDSLEPRYAGFWIRVLAVILDSMFLLPIVMIAAYFLGYYQINSMNIDINHNTIFRSVNINSTENYLFSLMAIIYSAILVSSGRQATWGKRAVGIYIANEDGSKLSTLKAALRYISTSLSALTFGMGFILVALNKEKAALHDFICKTRVFYGKK